MPPWWGAVAGVLVALGGGVLRDLWLGLPVWALEYPQFILLAAGTGFLASRMSFPVHPALLGATLLLLDFAASVAFGLAGGERAFALTHDPMAASLGSALTATGGGFMASLIGKHQLGSAYKEQRGKTPLQRRDQ